MQVKVTKLTSKDLLDKACSFTVNKEVHPSLAKMYDAEHSVIRTQLFCIELFDIATFVSVHLVRHNVGITHYVKSNREDRIGYTGDTGRNHPVNHMMILNAQSLINMARKRLCGKAHKETRDVMQAIVNGIEVVDPDLWQFLVPECVYRGRCHELKPCKNGEVG